MQSELSNHLDFGSLTGICAIDDGGHNILVITLIAIAPGILLILFAKVPLSLLPLATQRNLPLTIEGLDGLVCVFLIVTG